MSQFNFIVDWDDVWAILTSILSLREYSIVFNKWYMDKQPIILHDINPSSKSSVVECPSFYVLLNNFKKHNITMDNVINKVGKEYYVINNNDEYPFIELLLGGSYTNQDGKIIPVSMLAVDDPYGESGMKYKSLIVDAYKHIQTLVKAHMLRHKMLDSSFRWIGKNAYEALTARVAKLSLKGKIGYLN